MTPKNRPAPSPKVTGPTTPTTEVTSKTTPRTFPFCGCLVAAQCIHADRDAPRLVEPAELGPRCHSDDRWACGQFTSQQLEALGRRGLCCVDVLGEAS